MAFRIPGCRAIETASLWTTRGVVVDGVFLAEGGVAALLGLCGLRLVPMVILSAGWKIGEYVVKACAPLSLGAAQAALRPALGDLAVLLGGWMVGRIVRALTRRRERSRLTLEPGEISLVAEIDPRARSYAFRESPGQVPSSMFSGERSWTTPGALVLELEDREAEALRAAIDSRLEDLRRVADRPAPGATRDELWQTIATLESVLARLPAGHLYDRAAAWSQSGHRL